jgi:hypothetical protein
MAAQLTFMKDKNGWHTDEDAPKKSLTDALTKASQLIGMSVQTFSVAFGTITSMSPN